MTNSDPTSSFTVENAKVGNQIAKQPSPTTRPLCTAAIGSFIRFSRRKQTRELGTLDHRKIAALVGVAPINKDSGAFRGRRMVQGGRADVRRTLYMATLTATRRNRAIKNLYQRLTAAGRPAKLALTACMRKLLTILNAILRDQRPWQNA